MNIDPSRGNLFDEEHGKNFQKNQFSLIQKQAQSIACMILLEKYESKGPHLELHSSGFRLCNKKTLSEREESKFNIPFGENEAFRDEPAPGFGTAFFIGGKEGKLALTAAHCVCKTESDILDEIRNNKTALVFNFTMKNKHEVKSTFSKSEVYKFKVISHQYVKTETKCVDWALLELDKKVNGCEPLELGFSEKIVDKMPLYMLGHPSGLPLKLTKGGIVTNNSQRDYFSCDLYAFSGNSGSPVFCSATQKVIGILRSGGEDYESTDDYGGKKITRIQARAIESRSGFEKCQRMHTLLFKLDHAGGLNTRPFPKNEIGNFCLSLKNKYKSIDRLPRLLQENILPIETTYTQLVLLQSDKKEEKEKKGPVFEEREFCINSWEDIQREKQPIVLDKLFEKQTGQNRVPKRLLIQGKAGVGKSTLCHHIAFRWGQDTLWKDKFDALFWVPLRKLQDIDTHETFATFLFRTCCPSSVDLYPSEVMDYIENNKDRILFVLDGYDEVNLFDTTQKKMIDEFLKYPFWILTSRPYAALGIVALADANLENVGFTPETIGSYIHQSFSLKLKNQAETALQKIRQNPCIFGLSHIPINLELVSAILEFEIEGKIKTDISCIYSMSDLYRVFTHILQKSLLERRGVKDAWKISDRQLKEQLDKGKLAAVFEFLESAAWIGLEKKELLLSFDKGDLQKLYDQYRPQDTQEADQFCEKIYQTGFFQSGKKFSDLEKKSSNFENAKHSFLHLTFQEFFAARHLVRLLKSKTGRLDAIQSIKKIKFDPRFKVVIWFIAGLLKDEPENLNAIFDLLDHSKDAIGLYSALLKVRCLEECGWSDQLKKIKEYEEEIRWWCSQMTHRILWSWIERFVTEAFKISPQGAKRVLSPLLISLLEERANVFLHDIGSINLLADPKIILPLLEKLFEDKNKGCFYFAIFIKIQKLNDVQSLFPLLEKFLTNKSSDIKRFTVETIKELGQSNPNWAFPLIERALDDKSEYVKRFAIEAIVTLGQSNPQWAFPLIERALDDKEWLIRIVAVKAVGKLGQSNPQWAFRLIERAFDDKHTFVRITVVETLGEIGQSNLESAFLLIERALKDEVWEVRRIPVILMVKLAQSNPKRALPLIERIFDDEAWHVREDILKVVEELGQINPQWAFHLLERAFDYEHRIIWINAVLLLVKLGQSNPKWAFPLLERAFDDKKRDVREAAVKAVRELVNCQGQSNLQWVFPLIERAFDDKERLIRIVAVEAVGKLGQSNPQWASPLIERALDDKEGDIRTVAVKAVGKLSQSNPQWAFPLIERTLNDKEERVRIVAVKAVGKLGQSNSQWAFPLIERTLDNNEERVRSVALKAVVELGRSNLKWAFPLIKQVFIEKKLPACDAWSHAVWKVAQSNQEWDFLLNECVLKVQDEIRFDLNDHLIFEYCFLSTIDWSLSSERLRNLFLYFFKWERRHGGESHLSSTPLNSIIKNYIKEKSSQSDYILAIAIKSTEQNSAVFLDDDALCFYEKGEMHRIENVRNADQCIIDIQKMIKQLPEKITKLKEKK